MKSEASEVQDKVVFWSQAPRWALSATGHTEDKKRHWREEKGLTMTP